MKKRIEMDVLATAYGVNFTAARRGSEMSRQSANVIMVAWPHEDGSAVVYEVNIDQPWPAQLDIERVTAVWVKNKGQLDEAIAWFGAGKGKVQ